MEDIISSRGAYAENGLYEKYQNLSEIGIVRTNMPVSLTDGKLFFESEAFTQSGVQLLKFSPNLAAGSSESLEDEVDKIAAYPNPSSGEFYVQTREAVSHCIVYDISGGRMGEYSVQHEQGGFSLDPDMQPCMYFLELCIRDGYSQSVKIIKQ